MSVQVNVALAESEGHRRQALTQAGTCDALAAVGNELGAVALAMNQQRIRAGDIVAQRVQGFPGMWAVVEVQEHLPGAPDYQ